MTLIDAPLTARHVVPEPALNIRLDPPQLVPDQVVTVAELARGSRSSTAGAVSASGAGAGDAPVMVAIAPRIAMWLMCLRKCIFRGGGG